MSIQNLEDELETDRLVLKLPDPTRDANITFEIITRQYNRLSLYLKCFEGVKCVQDERKRLRQTKYRNKPTKSWVIWQKPGERSKKLSKGFAGMICVDELQRGECSIRYWLARDAEGAGYMSEALRAIEAHIWGKGIGKIVMECAATNVGSQKIIKRAGFTIDQTSRNGVFYFSKKNPLGIEIAA
jgi:RimJ/RimL family protein N-acetyltransferase